MGRTRDVTGPIVAVVLAAGEGRRFDGPTHKLLAPLDGIPVVRHAVDAAVAAAIGPVLVVTGAVDLTAVLPALVTTVHHRSWAGGQATSLQAGLAAAAALGARAVVVGLGDMPRVPAEAWIRVAAPDTDLVQASYDGRPGPPVRLARAVWSELPTSGDDGARVLLNRVPERVQRVAVPGSPMDVDVASDLDGGGGSVGR